MWLRCANGDNKQFGNNEVGMYHKESLSRDTLIATSVRNRHRIYNFDQEVSKAC